MTVRKSIRKKNRNNSRRKIRGGVDPETKTESEAKRQKVLPEVLPEVLPKVSPEVIWRTRLTEKNNPIKIVNNILNRTLTISYKLFDPLTQESDTQSFITHFGELIDIIGSVVPSVVILFYREGDAPNTYSNFLADDSLTEPMQTKIKEISKTIYENKLQMNDTLKDIDTDLNSPSFDNRLQLNMDGGSLVFFLNPNGSSIKTFAPTGHGGRFVYIRGQNSETNQEFICGSISRRSEIATLNGFGGSPDFNEPVVKTLIREMIEEGFEKLYRNPQTAVSNAGTTESINGLLLLNLILQENFTSIDELAEYFKTLHDNTRSYELDTLFDQVILAGSIQWNGLVFPEHTLPTGQKVQSFTSYFLTKQIKTTFTPEVILSTLASNYAKLEMQGIFVLKKTAYFDSFFSNLQMLLHKTRTPIQTVASALMDETVGTTFIADIEGILSSVEIDFFEIKYKDIECSPITLKCTFEYDTKKSSKSKMSLYLLTILIQCGRGEKLLFIKLYFDNNLNLYVESHTNAEQQYYTNAGGDLYFVLKYMYDQPSSLNPLSISGGRNIIKYTKRTKVRKSKRHTKKRRYRK